MPGTIAGQVKEMTSKLVDEYREELKGEWEQFTKTDKKRVEAIFKDFASLGLAALSGKDISAEMRFIEASISNIQAKYSIRAGRLILEIVDKVIASAIRLFIQAVTDGIAQRSS